MLKSRRTRYNAPMNAQPMIEHSKGYHTAEAVPYDTRFSETLAYFQAGLARLLETESSRKHGEAPVKGTERLWEAIRYSTLKGGKRMRPVLILESCRACGGNMETALPTACAVEIIHAFSLIHDDLPCMDNDDLRRGQPTLHKAFDEATALLTGDALLGMAFGLMTKHTPLSDQVTAQSLLDLVSDLSDVAGIHGLVNGQLVDILYEGQPYDEAVLEYIHTYKTGALFTFSAVAGVRLAGADAAVVEGFQRFGKTLGLAFQIVDDLLDVQSTSDTLGKTAGKDLIQKKATYPDFYGVSKTVTLAEDLVQEAMATLDQLGLEDTSALNDLARFIQRRIH
ncbi:MAG: polyprenyl synthetase family protein [Vampirovibrio sp.]|nr:polyprenyl synthetase family protein [Vampirovibrio sp.]